MKNLIRLLYVRFVDEPYWPQYRSVQFVGHIDVEKMLVSPAWGVTKNGAVISNPGGVKLYQVVQSERDI